MHAAYGATREGFFELTAAEAVAIMLAIQLGRELDLRSIKLKGDVKIMVEAVLSKEIDGSRWGHLIGDIKTVLHDFQQWRMVYVRREVNRAAHELARLTVRNVMDKVWTREVPDCIRDIIVSDQLALML